MDAITNVYELAANENIVMFYQLVDAKEQALDVETIRILQSYGCNVGENSN